MLDLLNYLLDSVTYFFEYSYQFISHGIYDLFVWAFAKFVEHLTISFLDFALWAIPLAWDTAQTIMNDLHLSSLISQAWSSLDSQALALLTQLRIPESLNILISGFFTKYVLKFIPFV